MEMRNSQVQKAAYRLASPALLLSNVRSIKIKMDELLPQTHSNWKYKECSAICLTTTWLGEYTPDAAVTPPGFSTYRADRSANLSLKSEGGGVCYPSQCSMVHLLYHCNTVLLPGSGVSYCHMQTLLPTTRVCIYRDRCLHPTTSQCYHCHLSTTFSCN